MTAPYTRAPHRGGYAPGFPEAVHAALLIDFDNVTMGMRSDLSKELKNLLDTDVIKGKVSVQRAYADWRRYPQYIVPLSEASVDLIFAPAYGSNKKNATDIRMAIDALELVFTRPEIVTFILLTGDSDFSSLVLKLKEYGKYVIGVGIQESSSDILVQNCDEYYSYTSLTGLTKTTELPGRARDPWVLVKEAVTKMVSRGDVLRSDRLKQVMQELDPAFDEGAIGFSKFSKFLAEASSRGLLELVKVGNGQYEVGPGKGRTTRTSDSDRGRGRRERGRGGRRDRKEPMPLSTTEFEEQPTAADDPLQDAYRTLVESVERLDEVGRVPARDSDVKRKILEIRPGFDETELGFSKFSKFLTQAEEHEIVRLSRSEAGNLEVSLVETGALAGETARSDFEPSEAPEREGAVVDEGTHPFDGNLVEEPSPGPTVIDVLPGGSADAGLRLGPRRGSTRRRGEDAALPPFFEGQGLRGPAFEAPEAPDTAAPGSGGDGESDASGDDAADGDAYLSEGSTSADTVVEGLGLPSDPEAIVRYLTHRYKGVGEKTAEALVERFGAGLFETLHTDPSAIEAVVPAKRAEQLLEAWKADFERRVASKGSDSNGGGSRDGGRRRSRGRGRGRPRA